MFQNFKVEVKNQLSQRIKSISSDRGGEYYGRYDGSSEQRLRPFAKFIEECSIILQYNMLSSPSMNGVIERQNMMLKDTVRSMIRCCWKTKDEIGRLRIW